jgi:hypothetical protein
MYVCKLASLSLRDKLANLHTHLKQCMKPYEPEPAFAARLVG